MAPLPVRSPEPWPAVSCYAIPHRLDAVRVPGAVELAADPHHGIAQTGSDEVLPERRPVRVVGAACLGAPGCVHCARRDAERKDAGPENALTPGTCGSPGVAVERDGLKFCP